MKNLSVAIILGALAAPAWAQDAGVGDAAAGRALAEAWCAACHALDGAETASDAAPAFAGIAADPDLTPGQLRARIAVPHPPMPQLDPTEAQLSDLVAYITSLATD